MKEVKSLLFVDDMILLKISLWIYGFKCNWCVSVPCCHYHRYGTAFWMTAVSGLHVGSGKWGGVTAWGLGIWDCMGTGYPGNTARSPLLLMVSLSAAYPSWFFVTLLSFPGLVGRTCCLWPWACRQASASFRSSQRTSRCLLCCLSL